MQSGSLLTYTSATLETVTYKMSKATFITGAYDGRNLNNLVHVHYTLKPVCTCGDVKFENTFNSRKFTYITVGSEQWNKKFKEGNSFVQLLQGSSYITAWIVQRLHHI